jgi:cobalamin biosynthesis protein CobT
MNRDIIELREVVQKLVPLLAGKGLTVTQRGSQAYVTTNPRTKQPETVNIPNIPDNANPEFISAIQGFIDHEVAHVLHTDWNWYGGKGGMSEADLRNPKKRAFMNTHNIIEDVMIEREMCKTFPGSARNISTTRKWFLAKITDEALKGVKDPKEQFRYIIVPLMRALGDHEEMQEWMDKRGFWKHPLVEEMLKLMKPATLQLLKDATTTKETLAVAEEVHDILQGKILPPPPAPPAPEKKEEKKPAEPKKGKSKDKPEKEADEGEGERDHKDKSDEKEKKPGKDGKGDKQDEDDEGKGAEDPTDEEEDDAGDAGKSSKGDKDEDDAETSDGEDGEADGVGDDEEEPDGDASGAGDDEADPDGDLGDSKSSGEAADADEDSEGEAGSGGAFGAGEDGFDDGEPEDDGADDEDEGRRNSVSPVTTAGADGGGVGDIDEGSDQETQGGGGGVGNGQSKSLFDYEDDDFEKVDMSSQIAIKISEEAVLAMDPKQYLVFTREMDEIKPVEVPSSMNGRWVPEMEDETRQMTAKMQKDIERMMASQSHVIRTPGHRNGKLHAPSLFRVPQGDPRVFTQKQEHKSKDTAVSVVIDNSGSMSGPKMSLAMTAGYALCSTLDRVKIAHEVIGFTTGGYFGMPESLRRAMADDAKAARISWDRTSPLVLPIYKTFEERITAAVKARFAFMKNAQPGLAGNVDGESLEYCAERLLKRTEKRKVMLVLSDGQPAGSMKAGPHLSYVVQQLGKMGIECVGIGIMDDSVKRFYPKYTVLRSAAELPGQVMAEIKKILTSN